MQYMLNLVASMRTAELWSASAKIIMQSGDFVNCRMSQFRLKPPSSWADPSNVLKALNYAFKHNLRDLQELFMLPALGLLCLRNIISCKSLPDLGLRDRYQLVSTRPYGYSNTMFLRVEAFRSILFKQQDMKCCCACFVLRTAEHNVVWNRHAV